MKTLLFLCAMLISATMFSQELPFTTSVQTQDINITVNDNVYLPAVQWPELYSLPITNYEVTNYLVTPTYENIGYLDYYPVVQIKSYESALQMYEECLKRYIVLERPYPGIIQPDVVVVVK